MILYMIIEVIVSLIENVIGLLFIGNILGIKTTKYKLISIFSILLTLGLLVINYFSLFSALATIYGIAGMTLCSYIIYKEKSLDNIVAVGCYFLLLHLLDFFLITLLGAVTGITDYGSEITKQLSIHRVLCVLIAKALLIIGYICFYRFANYLPVSSKKIIVGIVVALSLIYRLEKKLYQEIKIELVGMGVLLLSIIIMAIYLIKQYSEAREAKLEAEMLRERNHVMVKGYEDMMQNYKNNFVYFHDMKHHFMCIKQYLVNHENIEALNYINRLDSVYKIINKEIWTGTALIDFILNNKHDIAEKSGIDFIIDADNIQIKDMDEMDLCALLGNIIDNAIEHCEMSEGIPEVRIAIRKIQKMLILKVTNTCSNSPPKDNNGWVSSKKDKSIHGWGMRSIEMIVEKYGAALQHDFENGRYSITLTFFN